MIHIEDYFEVVENTSGWRVYHIPTSICPDEDSAVELVEDCDAYEYIVDEEFDFTSISSIELITDK